MRSFKVRKSAFAPNFHSRIVFIGLWVGVVVLDELIHCPFVSKGVLWVAAVLVGQTDIRVVLITRGALICLMITLGKFIGM